MHALLLWLLVTSLFLADGQLFLMLMRRFGRGKAGRQLWFAFPLAFGPLTWIFLPWRQWLLGLLLLATVWHVAAHGWWARRARQQLRPCEPGLGESVREAAEQWRTQMPRVATGESGPGVFGLMVQTLVLPPDCATLSPLMQKALLAHELAHVRHHDPLKLWCMGLAQRLIGWHPLARAMVRSLRLEIELAADEQAIAWMGDSVAYAAAIGQFGLRQASRPVLSDSHWRSVPAPGAYLSGYDQAELVVRLQALVAPVDRPHPLHIPRWLPGPIRVRLARSAPEKPMAAGVWQGFLLYTAAGYAALLAVLLHWLG